MEILIPTINRHRPLSVTLAALAAQDFPFDLIISDQSDQPITDDPVVSNLIRVMEFHDHNVKVITNPMRRGIAQQRQLLFEASSDKEVLCLDDDVWLGPQALTTLDQALSDLECGFVGMPLIGLSYLEDIRPWEQEQLQFWKGKPVPEVVTPDSSEWARYQLHNAATPAHIGKGMSGWKAYKIAWIGGCVLYQREALEEVDAWEFWSDLPTDHAGEDVAVQMKIMARRGGAGILPSQAFHQEVETTIPQRLVQAYQ